MKLSPIIKIGLIALFIFFIFSCQKQEPFDCQKWRSVKGDQIVTETRFSMTDDLLKSQILIGKSRSQIETILGPSDNHCLSDSRNLYFMVQEVFGSNIDPEQLIYLKVKFHKNGKCNNLNLISN